MNGRRNGRIYECVTVDLNTQRDFCDREGALPVANLGEFIPALRRVIAWAKRNYAPVISSLHSHRPLEFPERDRPVHCVDGSNGQRKIPFTVFPLSTRIEFDNMLSVPLDLFRRYQQVMFRMRADDLLGNPKADRFLTQLPTEEYVIFGNAIECSIKALALGLLARHKKVTVVVDACGYWNKAAADLALRQMEAKGARLITVDELSTRKLSRRRRYRAASAPGASPSGNGRGNGRWRRKPGPNGRARGPAPNSRLTRKRSQPSEPARRDHRQHPNA